MLIHSLYTYIHVVLFCPMQEVLGKLVHEILLNLVSNLYIGFELDCNWIRRTGN